MAPLRNLMAFTAAAFILVLTACSTSPAPAQQQPVAAPTEAPVVRTGATAYTLGNGDQLRITVFGQPDLSGQFEVDGAGAISLPLIGQMHAEGLTTRELEAEIVAKLDGDYILNPRVSAEVINYRPFYILGEVNKPGEYPYTSGLSVLNAVAAAGGFTYRANKKVVYIKSVDGTTEQSFTLDTQTQVNPGDTLRIGERIF